jgi:hypothetical protein
MLQSWQMYRSPVTAMCKLVLPILFLFALGLLPWFDNWGHLGGFIQGFMLSFALMPYISFGKFDRRRKIITLVVCLGASIALFIIQVVLFYSFHLKSCEFCLYFNCIPFKEGLCDSYTVTFKNKSTYADYY